VLATVVEWGDLLDVVWTAAVAGVGVTCAFAFVILGATRAVDLQRHGRPAEAGIYGLLGIAALLVFAAAVVLGIIAMTSK
jgi:hypothetical protein